MSWLAKLDARAGARPFYVRWPYLCLKWTLIALGVYLAIGSAWIELREKRVGIGTGLVTTAILAGIKGLAMGRHGRTDDGAG